MPHWFDDLTANLAEADDLPRRSFFRIIGAALGAGVASRVPFSGRAFAQTAQAPRTMRVAIPRDTAPDNCGRRRSGHLVIRERSVDDGGLTLNRQISFDRRTQSGKEVTTISRGPTVLLKTEAAATKDGAVNITAAYGTEIQGIKNLTLTGKDAGALHGSVDGRAFSADRTTRQTNKVQFADGKSAPKITADPKLKTTMSALETKAKAAFGPCSGATLDVGPAQPRQPVQTRDAKTYQKHMSGPGEDWYLPGESVVTCNKCMEQCGITFAEMTPGVWAWLSNPFAAAAAEVAAFAWWVGCMAVCQLPGGGCLPEPCGDFTTCREGDTCFDYHDGRLCCKKPGVVCQGVCCGTDVKNCRPDGSCGCSSEDQNACGNDCCDDGEVCTNGVCCKPGNVVCKGVCCGDKQVCNNGVCCSKDSICGSACCDELMTCADKEKGICCSFAHPVCNGKCCAPGSQCIGGKCCSANSLCGGVCCPNGQTCVDPKTHKCASCKPATVPCLPEKGTGICCAPNVTCCPGVCCKPGEWCHFQGMVNNQPTYKCGPATVPK